MSGYKPSATVRERATRNARKRVGDAVGALLRTQPFWGACALRLDVIEDETRDTLASDGGELRYNAQWVEGTSLDIIQTAIARVCSALMLKHHTRRGSRDYTIWQRASQDVTHALLAGAGFALPDGVEVDPRCDDMSAEQRYDELNNGSDSDDESGDPDEQHDDASGSDDDSAGGGDDSSGRDDDTGGRDRDGDDDQRSDQGDGDSDAGDAGEADDNAGSGDDDGSASGPGEPHASSDPSGTGEILDSRASSDAEVDEEERQWDEVAAQAAQLAKAEGKLPGAISDMLDDWHRTQTAWQDMLAEFCDESADDDYSWTPGDRRLVSSELYLPDIASDDALPPFVLMVDVSGSVFSEAALTRRFWSELRTIVESLSVESVTVIQFDSRVTRVDEFEAHDMPEELMLEGGGGTDFRAPFEWLAQMDEQPPFVLVFTDMLSSHYPDDPGMPVMWCNYERSLLRAFPEYASPPFGTRLDLVDLEAA